MSTQTLNGAEFSDLARQILLGGHAIRFQAAGASMQPFIYEGDLLIVAPDKQQLRPGEVAFAQTWEGKLVAHRVVRIRRSNDQPDFLLQGDAGVTPDGWFCFEQILGRVVAVEHRGQTVQFSTTVQRWRARAWILFAPLRSRDSWLLKALPQPARAYLRKIFFGGW